MGAIHQGCLQKGIDEIQLELYICEQGRRELVKWIHNSWLKALQFLLKIKTKFCIVFDLLIFLEHSSSFQKINN